MQVIYKLKSLLIHQELNGFCLMPVKGCFILLSTHLTIYHLTDLIPWLGNDLTWK